VYKFHDLHGRSEELPYRLPKEVARGVGKEFHTGVVALGFWATPSTSKIAPIPCCSNYASSS
jgi:hypothetical protein